MILKENMTSIVQRCEKEKEHLTETDGNNGDRVAIYICSKRENREAPRRKDERFETKCLDCKKNLTKEKINVHA